VVQEVHLRVEQVVPEQVQVVPEVLPEQLDYLVQHQVVVVVVKEVILVRIPETGPQAR
jgi:hypothetical protein